MRHLLLFTILSVASLNVHAQKARKQINNCSDSDSVCVAEALINRMVQLEPGSEDALEKVLDRLQNCSASEAKCTGLKVLRAINLAFGRGSGGPIDPQPPIDDELLGTVDFYHDDGSCSSSKLMGSVIFTSDAYSAVQSCKNFAAQQSEEVWGWRLSGRCENISDVDPAQACLNAYKKLGGTGVLGVATIYHDDGSCSSSKKLGESIIMTDSSASAARMCEDAGRGVTEEAWGWSLNGKCENISDTTFKTACINAYKKMGGTENLASVDFYHDDGSCSSSKHLASVVFSESASEAVRSCQRAAQNVTEDVWGLSINGKCENITDAPFLSACTEAYKKAMGK